MPSYQPAENSSDKENKSEVQFAEPRSEKSDSSLPDQSVILNSFDDLAQEDTSDEGWQEAVPKGRTPTGRKPSGSKRPSLAKLNTNFMNAAQRYRGKPGNFTSARTSPNEQTASSGAAPVPKKFSKSASFSPKLNNPGMPTSSGTERVSNPKSAPASPASIDQIAKSAPMASQISVQAAGKLFSYKEVALAPPGTIVKAVAEQLPKENLPNEQNSQLSQEIAATEVVPGEVATVNDVEGEKVQRPIKDKEILVSEEKTKSHIDKEQHTKVEEKVATDPLEVGKIVVGDVEVKAKTVDVKNIGFESTEAKAVPGVENSGIVKESNYSISKSELSEDAALDNTTSSELKPRSVSTENTTQLPDKETSNLKIKVIEGDENLRDSSSGDMGVKPEPTEKEKQDEPETGKETTKKLSAAAPPFNPSTVPVFGSVPVPVPGYKEHGGILPPPVNIPPMLTVNPVRRSPHQSATARVPYGPRLSGGYNRSGNRGSRNKPSYHNGEHNGDGNHFSPPRIMNPLAAEFVPTQPWVPNGYPVSPNGFLPSPNGYPVSPNGIPVSPNGYPASPNGIPVAQNGFSASPVSSVESSPIVNVDIGAENIAEAAVEENKEAAAEEIIEAAVEDSNENPSTEVEGEGQTGEQKPQEDVDNVDTQPKIEEKHTDTVPVAGDVVDDTVVAKDSSNIVVEEKPSKCWGDYSDSETEIIEVTS